MSFKTSFIISPSSDMDKIVVEIENQVARIGLSEGESLTVVNRSTELVHRLYSQGMTILNSGSQMRVTQLVEGPEYQITIRAEFGVKPSLWSKLVSLFR